MNKGLRVMTVKFDLLDQLKSVDLDKNYFKASGQYLYYADESGEHEVLDLVGGFGATLLGHNYPDLIAEAQNFLSSDGPINTQGSRRSLNQKLCEKLNNLLGGGYKCVLTNTGAETVEAAIKHAVLQWKRTWSNIKDIPVFFAVERGFHGKTSGALQLTSSEGFRGAFGQIGVEVVFVKPNDLDDFSKKLALYKSRVAGVVYEPIQGEGGVRPLEPEFIRGIKKLIDQRSVPLIADEIQTGFGRAGSFLCSQQMGVEPDYVLLAKALGGGVAKIGVLLIREELFAPDFTWLHSSTFAGDEYSSAVALKTLEVLFSEDGLINHVHEKSCCVEKMLKELAEKYPQVISGVRGKGLMWGLEFSKMSWAKRDLMRMVLDTELLTRVSASFLLHNFDLRVLPTLSDPCTIRLQPSVLISDKEIEWLRRALEGLCESLIQQNVGMLFGHLLVEGKVELEEAPLKNQKWIDLSSPELQKHETRAAFFCHFPNYESLVKGLPELKGVGRDDVKEFCERIKPNIKPWLISSQNFTASNGKGVYFDLVGLPVTSEQILKAIRSKDTSWVLELISNAVDESIERGCKLIGLGQFSSIVTNNGVLLEHKDVAITTGNSLTAALGLDVVQRYLKKRAGEKVTLGVVGAIGNVCSGMVKALAKDFDSIKLIGRKGCKEDKRYLTLAEEIVQFSSKRPQVEVNDDLAVLSEADVVVVATNEPRPIIFPEHLKKSALVCDLSYPRNVDPKVLSAHPDVEIIQGGMAQLPGNTLMPTPCLKKRETQMYACMAEVILLAMNKMFINYSLGPLSTERIHEILDLFYCEGFENVTGKSWH